MTLLGAILRKVLSGESIVSKNKLGSPPPELDDKILIKPKTKKKGTDRYSHVRSRVDSTPPRYSRGNHLRHQVKTYGAAAKTLTDDNLRLLLEIRNAHHLGRIDSRWQKKLPPCDQYYNTRIDFYERTQKENKFLYKIFSTATPKIIPTKRLDKEWVKNRKDIVLKAKKKFVLFPPVPEETVEDAVFIAASGVKRPRLYLDLKVENSCAIGSLLIELFTDVCPLTCQLFQELLEKDPFHFSYKHTKFFRKVPNLYWSGGDVVHDNGFGCYAQHGRLMPIGAENFHFSHSMPGLLSMQVTQDDEMCGIFNITFKAMPQFDLHNVVFGRVVRPCPTYDVIRNLGAPLNPKPVVRIAGTRVYKQRYIRNH